MQTTFLSPPEPRYPDIEVAVVLDAPEGNAFSILGCIQRELKRAGVEKEERDEFINSATSGDYDHLLRVCGEWVTFSTF